MKGLIPDRARAWLPDLAALAFLAAAVTAFFVDALLTPRVFSFHDHLFTFRPFRMLAIRMLQEGVLPLWNPHVHFGQPFQAVLMQTLYPTTCLYSWLSFETAFKVEIVFHYGVAAFGTYALSRRIALSPVASTAAATSYALGSFLVSDAQFCNSLVTAGWAPWVVLALVACAKRPGLGRIVLAALVLVLALIGGEVQTLSFAVLLALPLALGEVEGTAAKRLFRVAWPFAVAGALGAALAMVQILPSREMVALSPRGAGLTGAERAHFALTALTSLEMLVPKVLGNPAGDAAYLGGWAWGGGRIHQLPYFLSIYVGWVPLCLWTCGALLRKGVAPKALGLLAVLAFLMMLGPATPLFGAIESAAPFLRSFRFPIKYFTLFSLAGAVLAGMGVEALLAARWGDLDARARRILIAVLALAAIGLAAGGVVVAGQDAVVDAAMERACAAGLITAEEATPTWRAHEALLDRSVRSTRDTTLLHAAMLLAAFWVVTGRSARRAAASAIVLLLALDLARANLDVIRLASPEDLVARPPLLDALPPDAARSRVVSRVDLQEYPRPPHFRFRTTEAGSWMHVHRFQREGLMAACGLEYGLSYGNLLDVGSIYPASLRELSRELYRRKDPATWVTVYERTGVRHVIALEPMDDPRVRLRGTVRNDTNCPFHLYELDGALPRALLVPRARRFAERRDLLATWLSPGFDPRGEVLLEGDGASDSPDEPRPLAGEVEWLVDRPLEVRLRTNSSREGWLLLLDSWWPGWLASVDGVEATIERADHLFRAVRVPAGRHEVRFWYDPPSFRWGARISLGTLGLVLVGLARRKRGHAGR